FGHAEGDRVLRSIAMLLVSLADAEDRVFRVGGEEFAILCNRPHSLARVFGETIRQAMKGLSTADGVLLSVSGGIATVDASTRALSDLFELADRRLYAAKSGGRDRMVGDGALHVVEQAGSRPVTPGR
ncbi:GGDEF domain-containing protein, partial [Rhizobiaceae sp. 2RAB30]